MDIQDNHFALFGIEPAFAIDAPALDRAYREVQTQVHPDRFARAGAAEQRVALQWATRANEAYRVLRDPLRRAAYLCTLNGTDPADEHNTTMPQDFLLQQLAWRESLDDARDGGDPQAVKSLTSQLNARLAALQGDVEQALDRDHDTARAVEAVRQWMFIERFGEDVRAATPRPAASHAPVH